MKRMISVAGMLLILFSFSRDHFVPANEAFRQDVLSRINTVRSQGCNCGNLYMAPADPLVWNDNLEISAYNHAADMSNNRYFSHFSLDGKRLRDRNILAGYTFSGFQSFRIGENIAQGQQSLKQVINDWVKSPEHCKNLMDPNFKEVGLAIVNSYWVQDFGVRRPFNNSNYTAGNKP